MTPLKASSELREQIRRESRDILTEAIAYLKQGESATRASSVTSANKGIEGAIDHLANYVQTAITEAKIKVLNEAQKEILSIAYRYAGGGDDDALNNFCDVDDLSRISTEWLFNRIQALTTTEEKHS